ncbi:MAG: DUF2309 family protein, partial [Acidimicrobiales bacterium]|nr:DUF2309 family protein [Acidimicrobiales bacterium]
RVDEMRGLLARLNGWAGLSKWRNDWAAPDEERPRLAPIDVVAALALTEAAVATGMSVDFDTQAEHDLDEDALLDARVAAVAAILAPSRQDASSLEAIREVLSGVSTHERHHIWLMAQEHHFDRHLIAKIDRIDPGPGTTRPAAQAVFCIDVRSEGLRRHIEELGSAAGTPIETIGFAGFFGVPLKVRKLGWDHAEARCPVLVAPTVGFSEHPHVESVDAAAGRLGAARARDAVRAAHSKAKKGQGSAFAMAEAAGWLVGPMAAAKTFVPRKAQAPSPRASRVIPDDGVLVDQKIFAAESVLRTMGLIEGFAPLVLLCGHGSATVNNPHATALDCGACAGASGDDNALAVAGLLNDADVRLALHDRGISIPDDTWFVAGLHDTASDHVSILDKASAPHTHLGQIDQLQALLDRAGRANAADRAQHLVGPQHKVRDRGADWAQVRPEWGLARAAAFIIGPRSLTAGVDLEGRAFLHSYDQANDPTGRVLETIMTAPLVVGHWIGSQYYFSTVDPERFGAGDKLVHNPIGSLGVVSGPGGDLRVGLPLQSTHVAGARHHQPLRLLAVIQADLELIEQIIAKNKVLQTLIGGSWLRIAARSHPHEPWSLRTAAGTWLSSPSSISAGTLRPGIELEPIVHTRS